MGNDTLDETARDVLAAIGDGRVAQGTIEARLGSPPPDLAGLLEELRENALVREAGADSYELTENGVRVLNATGSGDRDERIDTPSEVEAAIEELELPPGETAAVRAAFSFLRHWGDATTAEIVDGTYSEHPVGYDDPDRWWADCVGDRLAALPRVEGSADAGPAAAWEYEGIAVVEQAGGRDGRAVLDRSDESARSGSVRHGIEEAARDDEERRAARAAFAALYRRGSARSSELVEAAAHIDGDEETVDVDVEHGAPDNSVVVDYPSGFESAAAWAERLTEIFEVLPGVEREWHSEDEDEAVWTYSPGTGVEVST